MQAIEAVDGVPDIETGLDATRDYRAAERGRVAEAIAGTLTAAGVTLLGDNGEGAGIRARGSARRK